MIIIEWSFNIDVKQKLSEALMVNVSKDLSSRQIVEQIVKNVLHFGLDHESYFMFIEQFSNAPIVEGCYDATDHMFQELFDIFDGGKKKGDLKNLETALLVTFCYQPIVSIVKEVKKMKRYNSLWV